MKTLSFRKIRKILNHFYRLYKRKKKKLDPTTQKKFEESLSALHLALKEKDSQKAHLLVEELQKISKAHLPKTFLDKIRDFLGAVLFALVIAVIVRQMWFEFYNIPTGSMRPTFKEKDFLVVLKNDYGLNIPLANTHFYFNSDLLKRGNIIIFSGKGMDIFDVDTKYFYLFPGKKQYVKRLIGKPGDTLYFYGGLIYGIDKDENPIEAFNTPWLSSIEHIPFIRFEGKVVTPAISAQGIYTPVFLYQMNEPIARLELSHFGRLEGEKLFKNPVSYSDLWGMKNYAMARLLTKDQMQEISCDIPESSEDAPLYLELTHHPSISRLILSKDEYNRTRPSLSYNRSIIPMKSKDLTKIFSNIYTARFVVKNGKIARYRMGSNSAAFQTNPYLPELDHSVPDGIYEFDRGTLYQVKLGGYLKKLPLDHPLYLETPESIQLFFNLGIEFDIRYSPHHENQFLVPSRYAYFRNGSLYLLGHPILSSDDQTLKKFLLAEEAKGDKDASYQPFIDLGPPILENGNLNIDLIQKAGIKIPEGAYLALGDNHAMSSDSRDFGFVPQRNLKGGANFIFWPPSNRWGKPFQPNYLWFSFPKIIIWGAFIIIIVISFLYYRKRKNTNLKF